MEIKVLGTGCSKCKSLEKAVHEAVDGLDADFEITKEEDIVKIMEYGILQTPGLAINGKVVVTGRVPSIKEIKNLISQNG